MKRISGVRMVTTSSPTHAGLSQLGENLLRTVLDLSPFGVMVVESESGKALYANRRFFTLWGLESLWERDDALDSARLEQSCRARLADSASLAAGFIVSAAARVERELVLRDGRRLRFLRLPLSRGDDLAPVLVHVIEDVTERMLALASLRASEQRYRALFEQARDAIFLADPDSGRILDVNDQGEALLRRPRQQIVGLSHDALYPADLTARARELFAACVRAGYMRPFEFAIETSDGERIPVEISASTVRLADDRLAMQGVFRDIRERKAAELAQAENAQFYQRMFRANRAVKLLIDPDDGRIVDANEAAAAFYGYPVERLRRMWIEQINVLPAEELTERLHRASDADGARFQFRHRLASGELRDVEVFTGTVNLNGKSYLHSIVQDVTEQYRHARLQAARLGILELVARDRPLDEIIGELLRLLGAQLSDMQAVFLLAQDGKLAPLHVQGLPPVLGDALLDGAPLQACELAGLDGLRVFAIDEAPASWQRRMAPVAAACWLLPVRDKTERLVGVIELYFPSLRAPSVAETALLQELGRLAAVAIEQRQLAEALVYQAQHDDLTGLPNRTLLHDRLDQAILHAQRLGVTVAVLLIDLDDFKVVNDSLGHSVGDGLLQQVAARLSAAVRVDDTVARVGGDEFALVLPLKRREHAALVADKLTRALDAPYEVAERQLHVVPSMGISLYPFDGATPEALLQAADTALYAAKAAGKNHYRYFAEAMNQQVIERFTLDGELRRALAEDQFELFFQPRVSLATGNVIGAEALLRWHHPQRGLLAPGAFLAVAEQSNLMPAIDAWVFRRACRQAVRWREAGYRVLLSVNLAAGQLHSEGLTADLAAVMADHGVAPEDLEIEITEGMLMRDIAGATHQLAELKRLAPGLRVAIDDFGSGYSSLNYLRRLPIDTLKIDRAFVADLADEQAASSAQAIIKTVVDLGQNLGLTVLAEGVETADQAALLRALGCHECQGYYFAKPLPLEQFEERLRRG